MFLILEILLGKKESKAKKAKVGQTNKGWSKSKKMKKWCSLTTIFRFAFNQIFFLSVSGLQPMPQLGILSLLKSVKVLPHLCEAYIKMLTMAALK